MDCALKESPLNNNNIKNNGGKKVRENMLLKTLIAGVQNSQYYAMQWNYNGFWKKNILKNLVSVKKKEFSAIYSLLKKAKVKLERYKSLSSAGSCESEDESPPSSANQRPVLCHVISQSEAAPPLASEDSDVGDQAEFESFSGTEEEEEECSLSVSIK